MKSERLSIKVDQFELKRVGHFKYLGTILSEKHDITKEITKEMGNKVYFGLTKLLSTRLFSKEKNDSISPWYGL